MPVSFAPARCFAKSPVARVLTLGPVRAPANDVEHTSHSQRVLDAALRHFAAHGLGAARSAGTQAEAAWQSGDRTGAETWLEICRTLDRRLSAVVAERMKAEAGVHL